MIDPIRRLLEFWFESADPDHMADSRDLWWQKDEDFDETIRAEFSDLIKDAGAGKLDDWAGTALGCVALLLLLDQFPRNVFRDQAAAFASDDKARQVCRRALSKGFDTGLGDGPRLFMYLPLEHSEDLGDQNDSVALMAGLSNPTYLDFAIRHRDVIERFGRFPHRNKALGRQNTPEEEIYLAAPGAGF